MRLFECVDSFNRDGKVIGQIKRVRAKYFFRFANIAFLFGVFSIINGLDWKDTPNATDEQIAIGTRFIMAGISLTFLIAPCLRFYPSVRVMSLSKIALRLQNIFWFPFRLLWNLFVTFLIIKAFILWYGFIFGSVVGVILIYIFAPHLFGLPLLLLPLYGKMWDKETEQKK